MKKNDELKKYIEETKSQENIPLAAQNNIAQDDEIFDIKFTWDYYDKNGEVIVDKGCFYAMSWKEIYKIIGVAMINKTPNFEEEGKDPISDYIFENESDSYNISKGLSIENSSELEGSVDYTCLVTILMQFNVLGYLEKKGKNWIMTEKGLNYFSSIVVVESKKKSE